MNGFNSRKEKTWIESVNLKTEQQKLPNMNNKEKMKWEKNHQSLWDMWDCNKISVNHVIGMPPPMSRGKRVC